MMLRSNYENGSTINCYQHDFEHSDIEVRYRNENQYIRCKNPRWLSKKIIYKIQFLKFNINRKQELNILGENWYPNRIICCLVSV